MVLVAQPGLEAGAVAVLGALAERLDLPDADADDVADHGDLRGDALHDGVGQVAWPLAPAHEADQVERVERDGLALAGRVVRAWDACAGPRVLVPVAASAAAAFLAGVLLRRGRIVIVVFVFVVAEVVRAVLARLLGSGCRFHHGVVEARQSPLDFPRLDELADWLAHPSTHDTRRRQGGGRTDAA